MFHPDLLPSPETYFRDELQGIHRPGQGTANITPPLQDKAAFKELINSLIGLANGLEADTLACIEGRGFLLGAPLAFGLVSGPVSIRTEKTLELHVDAVSKDERVLLFNDWVETGATLKTAIRLLEMVGAVVVGILALMDDADDKLKSELSTYN